MDLTQVYSVLLLLTDRYMYFHMININIAFLSIYELPALVCQSFNTHMTILYSVYYPLILIIRNNNALLSFCMNSMIKHNVLLYKLTLMLLSYNSKIYELVIAQGYISYLANGVCCETVGYMKNILDAVKPKKPTAIPKMLMLIVKYYINLVNIFVKQHCFNYCVSFTKFSGDICILCRKTAPFFQVIYSGPVYVKQYIWGVVIASIGLSTLVDCGG